ncbi:streptomycin 3'-adenylyltransferase [Azospirillum brasilense]|uniref:Aminoglycoside (3'') (9) adenylyltransferase n=2 Tax=Azospirillum baldaniorum TaxID=1064539 RepID=A0A9P1JPH7_9PROT|nr:streptomycin 3'-adenylyltransferase [Azospirillum brasilense]CCC97262.1 streptomycin 3''-adenylyltransferase [Azospirillum baldaniorum]
MLSCRDVAGILMAMIPFLTHEPRSCEQTVAAAAVVRDALGAAASAAYLYGSAVAGGLRPNSDLDILVVTERSLSQDERVAIVRKLLPISGSAAVGGPGRPVELTILARPALIPWRHPACLELQYGEWMRAEFERGDIPVWPCQDPDVAVLIETARRGALPLFGPPVAAVLDPVPRADFVRAMLDMVPILIPGIEEGDDRRNGLLTLARIWTTLTTGEILPKDQAADWALARLPEEHRRVLAHARAAYLGEEGEDWSDLAPGVRPHVDHVIARIQTLTAET